MNDYKPDSNKHEERFDDYYPSNDIDFLQADFASNDYAKRKSGKRGTSPHAHSRKSYAVKKGLKWRLLRFIRSKSTQTAASVLAVVLALVFVTSAVSSCGGKSSADSSAGSVSAADTTAATLGTASSGEHMIDDVPTILQDELGAGCETYACTILLQYYGFNINEFEFADKYLVTKPVSQGEGGLMYGPDMNSAYAGTVESGYGVYAPAMAKFMNSYLKTTGSKLKAVSYKGKSLGDVCEQYIDNDQPVMVWATVSMETPYEGASWIVDYVDENAESEEGDIISWMYCEHCLVLVGYDENNYYFSDPTTGSVEAYDKEQTELCYRQIGSQTIVLS